VTLDPLSVAALATASALPMLLRSFSTTVSGVPEGLVEDGWMRT